MEPISFDTLSDSDAVTLLFDLAGRGDRAGEQMRQLDALVHARLMHTYGDGGLPQTHLRAA